MPLNGMFQVAVGGELKPVAGAFRVFGHRRGRRWIHDPRRRGSPVDSRPRGGTGFHPRPNGCVLQKHQAVVARRLYLSAQAVGMGSAGGVQCSQTIVGSRLLAVLLLSLKDLESRKWPGKAFVQNLTAAAGVLQIAVGRDLDGVTP